MRAAASASPQPDLGADLSIATHHPQPPTIVQFGASSPLELARAAALAAPHVAGVDLNCGCPQSWACAETLGAALMDRRELVRDMVVATRARLAADGWAVACEADVDDARGRSVSVKVRIHDDLRRTVDFLDAVVGHAQKRLVDWVTIHPRTRRTPSTTPIRAEALDLLTARYARTLPILLSGDVFDLAALPVRAPPPPPPPTLTVKADAAAPAPAPSNTRLAGLMAARGLLTNPALFAGAAACPWEALETFMCRVARAPLPFKLVVHHVSEMCGPGMGPDKTALLGRRERARLSSLADMLELIDYLDERLEEHAGRPLRRDL